MITRISKYSSKIKFYVLIYIFILNLGNEALTIPPLIVVDFSWALINAIIVTFNNCSVVHYLKWAYDVSHDYYENYSLNHYMSTRVIICQVHLLKNLGLHK